MPAPHRDRVRFVVPLAIALLATLAGAYVVGYVALSEVFEVPVHPGGTWRQRIFANAPLCRAYQPLA